MLEYWRIFFCTVPFKSSNILNPDGFIQNRGLKLKLSNLLYQSFPPPRHVYHENRHPIQPLVAAPVFGCFPSVQKASPRSAAEVMMSKECNARCHCPDFSQQPKISLKVPEPHRITWAFNIAHAETKSWISYISWKLDLSYQNSSNKYTPEN